jgi:hypothetical protein
LAKGFFRLLLAAFFKGTNQQSSFLINFIEFDDIFCSCLSTFGFSFDFLFPKKIAFEAIELFTYLSNIPAFEVIIRAFFCMAFTSLRVNKVVFLL